MVDPVRDLHGIARDSYVRASSEGRQAPPFRAAEQRVHDQNAGKPGVRHHFRFAELGYSDAGRPVFDLAPRQFRYLVGLRVRAEPDPAGARHLGHLGDVQLDDVEVEHQRGRVEVGERAHRGR